MIKRTITNKGQPFLDERGVPLGGFAIQWQLVDATTLLPTDAFDKNTFEQIFPILKTVVTLSEPAGDLGVGEFRDSFWTTDNADHDVRYLVNIYGGPTVRSFIRPLPSGDTELAWYTFIAGAPPTSQDILSDSGETVLGDSGVDILGDSA
jgi:hypothetical protein